ncbi:MAG: hypothetical protein GY861_21205 [bacterium]|nr:hypothetical protein [bacterium]
MSRRGNTKTLIDIPLKYRTTLQGSHNENVYMCKCCCEDLTTGFPLFGEALIGFAELNGELVIVYRCPACQEILYHHAMDVRVKMFLEYISER